MAWTEQCKIALCSDISYYLSIENKKHGALNRIFKKLSKESDIPISTLKKWYYSELDERKSNKISPKSTKNGTNQNKSKSVNHTKPAVAENQQPEPSQSQQQKQSTENQKSKNNYKTSLIDLKDVEFCRLNEPFNYHSYYMGLIRCYGMLPDEAPTDWPDKADLEKAVSLAEMVMAKLSKIFYVSNEKTGIPEVLEN